MGRQPWVVFGVMKTSDAVSGTVGVGFVATTLIGFTVIYAVLSVIDVVLLTRFARGDPPAVEPERANGSKPSPELVY
jgi:cytochrome d ubiquinol oxidase subunit I